MREQYNPQKHGPLYVEKVKMPISDLKASMIRAGVSMSETDSAKREINVPFSREELVARNDPAKKEIFDAIGDLSKLDRLFSARVLVATYIQPQKSKGGILFTDKERQEAVYQGAVGLVIAKGPRAFKDDASNEFHGQEVHFGEWVVFRPGDSKRVQVNGVNCRIVDDTQIDMVVTTPDWVTHRLTDARVK